MEKIICGFVLPMLLLSAALLNRSLISLVNLSAFLTMQFIAPKLGSRFQRQYLVLRSVCFFSFLVLISHVAFYIISIIEGDQWSFVNSKWAKLIGFIRVDSWKKPSEIYVLIIQILVAFVALLKISHWTQLGPSSETHTCLGHFCSSLEHSGSHLRVLCYLLLPPIQLTVGISHPSWASFPFFICSSVGLIYWSFTSNFLGLFWWWTCLLLYAGSNIFLLYLYQLQIEFPELLVQFAEFVGMYKISANSEWSEICSALSLLSFYILLSWIRCDLAEINKITMTRDNSLSERLLSSKDTFLLIESRSGSMQVNILSWREFFQTFSINFFTYGFPVLLLALSFWGFHFASLCSFGLLAYVGYITYAFPSMFHLHRLNGLLLVFILLWADSTYVFNLAFSVLNKRFCQDMEIWETVGLWHYTIPGFYLLAQFCLAILVAMGNLVNNSVFVSLTVGARQDENYFVEEKEEMKVLVVATIAWILRKCYRAIMLSLLLLLAIKPGFFHAAYMIFFLVYLLGHNINKKLCRSLILLCEAHFALLYILRLHLFSKLLDQEGSVAAEILQQLGLRDTNSSEDLLKITVLACFCALHNHGIDVLFSFSAIVQQTPFPPVGFSILRAGLIKSVLFSVYTSQSTRRQHIFSSHEKRIMMYLSAIGEKILSLYRSCGTYIAFVTILVAVYLVRPNYVFFGYLLFLLLWITGRQLLQRTTKHLWFPLKLYAIAVFILVYSLCVFSNFQSWFSGLVEDLPLILGYDSKASVMENVSEPLAILISIQLFSYERRRSESAISSENNASERVKLSFSKRLLIWHREKILYIAVLYASISPIGAFGFLYILGLVISSTLPKSSEVPSKIFLVYSGCLLMMDYLFQMWGEKAEMFPDQRNYHFSVLLGLELHEFSFRGLESGFRGKVVVIVACLLQYNIFHWLDHMPRDQPSPGKWGEACDLFDSKEEILSEISKLANAGMHVNRGEQAMSHSWPCFSSEISRAQNSVPFEGRYYNQGRKKNQYLYTYFWESYKGSQKWNWRRIIYFRRERLHKQKELLKIYTKFWIQNMFGLFGLEINMVVLLLASFAVLNAISLIYVACLATCVILNRRLLQRLWPMFVFLFASIVGLEYLALWLDMISTANKHGSKKATVTCHDCWRSSEHHFDFCKKCWFGIVVDDPRMLISYYMVFMFSCFKLKADHFSSLPGSQMYQCLISYCKNASLLSDLSFETKELWTLLDYVRHYSYCHLLDLVLALILVTGTLEYDILHLGYLGFALVFFRMRLEILKKKNKLFKLLRTYNFALIVLSLVYQSPFIGDFIEGKCATVDYISEVIGFYKYDYGFRITSRSALVEIVIFMLVSLQSFMFSSQEFDYVSKYLEAEQIGAIVREQEKRASWKSAQLQNIRKSEEQKRRRNLQVEKMKSEVLNLRIQLHSSSTPPEHENFTRRMSSGLKNYKAGGIVEGGRARNHVMEYDFSDPKYNFLFPMEMDGSPRSIERSESPSSVDSAKLSTDSLRDTSDYNERDASVSFQDLQNTDKIKLRIRDNPLISAVNLIGDGVNQVQSLGNLAVNNLVTLLNIEHREQNMDDNSSEDGETYYEIESHNMGGFGHVDRAFSIGSENGLAVPGSSLGVIIQYMWGLMQSNNDVVCYCCFVLVFLWNFSLLSMVYLGALFVYALCLNTGPSHLFWVIVLIYSEFCILLQYLYQIIIQHCGLSIHVNFLQELGFPENKITSSFVISNWPLFLIYLFTLLQTSITARSVQNISFPRRRNDLKEGEDVTYHSWKQRLRTSLFLPIGCSMTRIIRGLYRYWNSLTRGAEAPPYFVQVSMDVKQWPEDGIQPERIESGINELLSVMHSRRCKNLNSNFQSASRVRIQSIERSTENPHIALAVFEVLHASPLTELSSVIWQNSLTPAADVAHEILMGKAACVFEDIGFPYPIVSVIGGGKREIDLYAYIFCADLVVFFLVAFFYQSIIKNKSEFLEVYQLEDQFPKEFVFILMVIFFLIVLDRIIYLCSFATGKVIFYLFSLALFTYSVTRYAWYTAPPNKRAGRLALRAIYLTKAVSLALQAIQIRYGIPRESTLYRQFLTSSATKLNYWGFRLYRALPFLYELRCVLDWSCTTTSLTMYDWLKLEDIHASLFLVKCDVDLNRSRHRQGEKQSKMTKFCGGICLFLVLICVIWAPMLMYSSGNPTNIANPIKDASVRVGIKTEGGRLTLFETTLCRKISWEDIDDQANLDPEGYSSAYNVQDVQLICCQPDASSLWLVPPMVQARFIRSLPWSMKIIFSWELMRDRPKGKEAVKYELEVEDMNLPDPSEVIKVLNGSLSSFTIYNVYPRFFRVTGSGDVRFLEQEVELVSGDLVLNRGTREWWSFHDIDAPNVRKCGNFAGPMAIVVSEETPQGILGETLSKFSIWGLYITFVLAVGRFIRLQCADLRMRIPFENLPCCERLLAICEDIYAARAEGELEVEEVLYWTLVKIYRSPHMLLEYTKPD